MLKDMTVCMTFIDITLFLSLRAPDPSLFLAFLCIMLQYMYRITEKLSNGEIILEIQHPTDQPLLKAWPTPLASPRPCSAQYLISPGKVTVSYSYV